MIEITHLLFLLMLLFGGDFAFVFVFFFYTTIAFIIYFSSGLWVCRKVREKLYNAPLDQKVSDE